MAENEPTAGEQRVLSEAPSGKLVNLDSLPERERVISSEAIRSLCVGPKAKKVDPRGIWIKGAHIEEPLDLSYCTIPHPLALEATTFDATPDLTCVQLPGLLIEGCSLPGVVAGGIQVRIFSLARTAVAGRMQILAATISGQLICNGATLTNEGGIALYADQAEIRAGVFLRGAIASGEVLLLGATIGGQLSCNGATLSGNEGGIALAADGAEIRGGVFLDKASISGEVRLTGATIGGLSCSGATLSNEDGTALVADGVEITGVFFQDGFRATGEVRLLNAKIDGALSCSGGTFDNAGSDALDLSGTEITGSVFLNDGFSAKGPVRLFGVRIGGQLACRDATLMNKGGVALEASHATIGTQLIFGDAKVSGGVRLFRASANTLMDDIRDGHQLGSWKGIDPLVLDGFTYSRFGENTAWNPGSGYRGSGKPRVSSRAPGSS